MKKFLLNILKKLEENHFEAYIVGGFVRDTLLGIKTYDIDICTDAHLSDLKRLFKYEKVFDDYWAIKIKYRSYTININTYRKELEYYNNKPVKLEYVKSLEEDLIRRDFTINSMCFDKEFNLIDILNAKADLDNRIIRVIGDVKKRLNEDKTRILRAIRLSCLLDFNIDADIISFIKENRNFLDSININKYKEELDKIISNNKFEVLLKFVWDNDLNDIFNFKSVFNVNSKEGIYSQLDMPLNYPFTKKEKRLISIFRKIIKSSVLDDDDILSIGLKNSLVIGKIININSSVIRKRYGKIKKSL